VCVKRNGVEEKWDESLKTTSGSNDYKFSGIYFRISGRLFILKERKEKRGKRENLFS